MSKISSTDVSKITDEKEFMRQTSILLAEITKVINGRLEFGSNIKTQQVDVSFTTALVDIVVGHELAKTGVKYIVVSKSAPVDVFKGAGTETSDKLYLQGDAVADVTLLLY